MNDLHIRFLELYKKVDIFIKDAYSTEKGVSHYIDMMERYNGMGKVHVSSWDSDFRAIKHLRWIRNKLSHEISFDIDFCTEKDYLQLKTFYNALVNVTDPLSILFRNKGANKKRRYEIKTVKELEKERDNTFGGIIFIIILLLVFFGILCFIM